MRYKTIKAVICVLTAVMSLSCMSLTADAFATDSVLPSGGIGVAVNGGSSLAEVSNQTTIPIASIVEWIRTDEKETSEEPVSAEEAEAELFRNLVIAQVNSYVNVRSLPSEEGEILGKLYNNSVGTFLSETDG